MAKNCKHFNSISRCAVLLMIAAGASAAAKDMPAEGAPAVNPAVQKVITNETALRTQILADIETQKKYAEKLTEDEKFSEAEATFKALLQQLAAIPGTEAKIKYEAIVKAQKKLHRKWAADILAKAHDLFDVKNYNEAIRVCSIINSFDAENGPGITGPFIAKCNAAIEAQKYNDAIDINKFNTSFADEVQDIDRYMRQAETYYNNGKYEQVMEVLEKVYLLDPFNVRATTLLDKTYGKVFSRARNRHRVTTQEMLAQAEWAWVMPAKAEEVNKEMDKEAEVKVAKNDIEQRMEKIRFPKFDSPGMDIIKILKFLDAQSKANDTVTKDGTPGVTIIPQFNSADLKLPKFQKIYMRFSDIPLIDILRYLSLNLGIKYKVDEYGSVLVGTIVDDMVEKPEHFPVRDDVMADILGSGSGGGGDTPAPSIDGEEPALDGETTAAASKASVSENENKMKEYFRARGVDFPEGSAIRYNTRAHRLEVINSKENLRRLESLLSHLESIEVPMVMTEVKFVEVSESNFNQLGFDWSFSLSDQSRMNGLYDFDLKTNFIAKEDEDARPSKFIDSLNLLPNFDDDWGGLKPSLNVTVHALSQNDNVEVLTTPRLISKSGTAATIKMVTETRYPDSWDAPEIETESDNVSTISFPVPELGEATPVGITMTVTPNVGPDNETISLHLQPEIITFLGSENSGYPVAVQQGTIDRDTGETRYNKNQLFNIWMPEFGKRSIDTHVKVRNGETIVLGGIISSTVERKEKKLPFIGSIPLFGRLFQNRSEESEKTNLLIFVTARLIKTSNGRPVKAVESNGTPHFNF